MKKGDRLCVIGCVLLSAVASAASISGTVTGGGGPVAGAQVRLWAQTTKGYSFAVSAGGQTATADSGGHYTFSGVAAGRYVIDAQGGTFADRWYQADGGSGYAEASVLVVGANDMLTGIDLAMDLSGGVDGVGQIAGGLSAGMLVRAELVSDPRVHHNDGTQADPHQGEYHLRGLPPGTWRIALHDQNGVYADGLASMLSVGMGSNAAAGTVNLTAMPSDPYEPNNSQPTATFVDAGYFQAGVPFATSGARIAPLNSGDVDWYCTSMRLGDRLVANAVGQLRLEDGGTHESPWVDPVMSLWRPDGTGAWQKVLEGDDNGPLVFDALLDTGELDAGGPMCVAVTTYGDTAYAGMQQGSAGDYQLVMKMGNRGPALTAMISDGGVITINEGDTLSIPFSYSDPEHDPLTATWDLRGASNAPASQGSFNTATGMSTFMWTASQTAARDSPYVLTLKVSDSEIARTATVTIQVLAVNVPPSVPVPLSPADGGRVATAAPQLVCSESSDLDQETTTYELQLEYGDGGQAGSVVGVDGGWLDDGGAPPQVAFDATTIPENSRVRWRVRAFDGHPANGYSAWSPYASFLVDVNNDPPLAPVITKPADGDEVLVRKPTIELAPPVDPEDDAMDLFVQLAKDAMFTMMVDASGPLHAGATPTMWTVAQTLDWNGTYYARARAVDARGGNSPYSDVVSFHVRKNQPPSVPPFVDPDEEVCNMGFTPTTPMSMTLGQSVDPEMDGISVELQIFLASEDPASATPVFEQTRLQTGASTSFDISGTPIPMNLKHRARARAVDAYGPSQWGECVFTVGEAPMMGTGGGSGGGGAGGGAAIEDGGTGGGTSTKGGCGCGSAEGVLALAATLVLRRRRVHPERSRCAVTASASRSGCSPRGSRAAPRHPRRAAA